MANAILGTYNGNKAFQVLGVLSVLLLIQKCGAYEFVVGGSSGWTVPTDSDAYTQWAQTKRFQIGDTLCSSGWTVPTDSDAYTQWAQTKRFQIGDTLLFVYPADKDSVLNVTKEDYDNCNISNSQETHSDGHTVFQFTQSGPHYFISGVQDHCQKNEKLVVVVLADRNNPNSASSIITSFICSIGAFLASSLFLVF